VIKVLVDVENEQPATELFEFYSHSIDLIQHVLILNGFLSETRSSHLQSIFSEMNFVSVDCIRLSYQYGENVIRKASSSSIQDSYIDESTRKFYILQKYEKNDSRHIDTMVNYLIQDAATRMKLTQFIRHFYKIYQKEGVEGLIKQREGIPGQQVSKWIIPRIIKKESNPSIEEEEEVNDDAIVIPPEMLEEMKNEPSWQSKKPMNNTMPDPNQPKSLTCYPPIDGAVSSVESLESIHPSTSSPSSSSDANNGKEQADDKKNTEQIISRESDKLINGEF
jgi:hypothetical protein